jgi:hypothetical protein
MQELHLYRLHLLDNISADLTVNDQNLEEVDSFTYLGGEVDNLGGSDTNVKIRIEKVRTAFNMMGSIWKARIISLKTKVRLDTLTCFDSSPFNLCQFFLHLLVTVGKEGYVVGKV